MTDKMVQLPASSFGSEGIVFPLMMTASSTFVSLASLGHVVLLKEHVVSNPTASSSPYLLSAAKTWRALRTAQIKSLRGKYRHALTPSDEFARQKQEEIALERAVS